jgi:site-specific DNA-methyltransferase (adenine-specific)/adenine-specific DNA-methyltransferase
MMMKKEVRDQIIDLLKRGEDVPAEFQEDLFPTTKKEYELKYAGKERKEKILSDTMSVPFQAVKHFGEAKEGEWVNKLIFGDNLQALKHLLKLKKEGKLKNADGTDGVRLIYIDPPFGTGDQYDAKGGVSAYSAKLQGTEYIEFLRKRLILLHELLSEDGLFYIRIDYHFGHYIKIILDEIFKKNNFLNEIVINRRKKSAQETNRFNVSVDSIYFYSKSEKLNLIKPLRSRVCSFCHQEKEPEWHIMISSGIRGSPEREILGRRLLPPRGFHWTYSQKNINKMTDENRIRINEKGSYTDLNGNKIGGMPEYLQAANNPVDSSWMDLKGYTSKWKYPTENSEELLYRIIISSSKEGDIILDCFAGSGTTGAVAEKLARKWIMIDCGKLAIYTIQKRLMNLKKEIGNEGSLLKPKPFVLYNAGLYYDGKILEHMQKNEYKDFVLELFGCQKRDHEINGLDFHGTLNNHSVIVFDKEHHLTEKFIDQLHETIGKSIKSDCFIIAPAGIVGFGQDYIRKGDKKYTILRIPNSIIEYIRQRDFTRLEQPRTPDDINQTIDAVGFDFIYPPKVKCNYYSCKPKGKLVENEYTIEILDFEPIQLGSKIIEFKDPKSEGLAMLMIDLDYDGETFQMDKYWFGSDITKNDFKISFYERIGDKVMIIYLDIFGNEKKEVLSKGDFIKR